MDPPEGPSVASPFASSPHALSPGGRSRYGRTRRPKISQDFYNIDDVIIDDQPPPRHSPVKSPKLKPPPKSPIIQEIVFDIKDEFTKLDDLGMKVANNFKTNLQRGLDDTIKERKFFKSLPESKSDASNAVDVSKVFKLISAKPAVSEVCEGRTPPKSTLKTYSNKRKHLHDSDSFVVESFGLPDEPIVPMNSPLPVERDQKIDVDAGCQVDVNLANPWTFEEFDPVPLYASEPVVEEFNLRGGALGLFHCDSLLGESTDIDGVFDITSKCQSTNFEKSRIPTPVRSESEAKCDIRFKTKKQGNLGGLIFKRKRILRSTLEAEEDRKIEEKSTSAVEKEGFESFKHIEENVIKVLNKKVSEVENNKGSTEKKNATKVLKKHISPLKKKRKLDDSSSRNLRSSIDNNNEVNKDNSLSSLEDSESIEKSTAKIISKPLISAEYKDRIINPAKISKTIFRSSKLSKSICNSQVRVVLNPLSRVHLVPNPLKLKTGESKSRLTKIKLNSKESITEALVGLNELKKSDGQVKSEEKEDFEEFDIKNIETEPVEFQVGDLAWAKIGTHPYWPCMITEEPVSGDHKRFIVNRTQPLYHVRFFGDNGRRSWVSAQHVMLYNGPDDLDKLAKISKAQGKSKAFIKQSFVIKPRKLHKWQMGVDEAESLKAKTVQEREDFFYEVLVNKRAKTKRVKDLDIKEEEIRSEAEESFQKKRSIRLSTSDAVIKKIKNDAEEIISESLVKQEPLEDDLKTSSVLEDLEEENATPRKKSGINRIASPDRLEKIYEVEEKSLAARKKLRSQCHQETFICPEQRKVEEISKERRQLGKKPASASGEETGEETSEDTKKNPKKSDETLKIEAKEDADKSTTPVLEARKKFLKKEELSEESLEARKKLRNFQAKGERLEERKEILEAPKMSKRNSVEENSQLEHEEKAKLLRNKRHQIGGEYSNSDTDSKFSDNSSVPASMESQAALYRRNNIFRGIPKEKVCQICEEAGEVFKCKGPCNGVYHYKCAMNQTSEEEKMGRKEEEVEKTEAEEEGKSNVEIVLVDSKKPLPSLGDSPSYKDSSSEEFVMDEPPEKIKSPTKLALTVTNKPTKKEVPIIKHVTADHISYICVTNEAPKEDSTESVQDASKHSKCVWCTTEVTPRCLICQKEESRAGSRFRQKCSLHQCGKYYHPECLKVWPQTQWSLIQSTKDKKYDTFVCPRHVCHTCISDDPRAANSRCPSDKVVKCLRCPATYHTSSYCVPAGTHILSNSQVVCPRHYSNLKSAKRRMQQTINTNWCFICSKGGNLICCETCPTSVHMECLPGLLNEDDTFFCEDCQSGRLPLYDEIVWVKLGTFRWWPALILFPNEVPDNVRNMAHNRGEFVVKFFGTYDHYWVGRGRTFLFQEGDKGHSNSVRKRVDNAFAKAIEEAAAAHQLKKQFKLNKVAEKSSGLKPPPYIRIKVNKPVGNVRLFDGNISNTTSCDCDPNQPHPCGPDSDCLNRLLLTECNPQVCPAGERCNNQCFEKREYPPMVPHRTQVRGWGLKTLAPIRKGQFVIEYVGEIIDEQEYQRRIQKMHEQKEENYYFLTIDKDRTLDAGPKGNVARFMNHSCDPNCETQKWTVNGDTRVGLFAKCDIPADTELTFNYNLECIGKEKKICRCGAPKCTGFIGVKVKTEGAQKKSNKPKKKKTPPPEIIDNENPCFICGKVGDVGACNNKMCTKYYHLKCVSLESWPEGGKWVCQWHNCNICSKRTIRCCIKCLNSYCPPHSQGNVRYDKTLPGFICFEHDPTKEANAEPKIDAGVNAASAPDEDADKAEADAKKPEEDAKEPEGAEADAKEAEEGAKKPEEDAKKTEQDPRAEIELAEDFDSANLGIKLNGCVTSTPMKKSKENGVSGVDVSVAKSHKKKTKREKNFAKVQVQSKIKNTANLFNSVEKEVKLTKFTPVRHLRTSTRNLNKTDPDKDLPIRKRNRLRCGNTL